MAKYRPIKTIFWEDEWVTTLSSHEKLLFLYLLTNPHTNLCGIYRVSIRYISFETGLTPLQVEQAFDQFQKDNKVLYVDGWVIIKNHEKHQTRSPKILEGIKRELSEIPQEIAKMRYHIDTLYIGTDKPVLKLKPKLELKLKEKDPYSPQGDERELLKKEESFETFWKSYPRRIGKGAARRSWVKLKCAARLPEILRAIADQKKTDQWLRDGGQFIPHPSTWLNQERWQDEPTEKPKTLTSQNILDLI